MTTPLAAGPEEPPTPGVNPWKSLHYYVEEDSALFFGRESEILEVVQLVQRDYLTVLFGRSGLGKTSLLRAGVMPRLRKEGFLPVIKRVVYSPSGAPPTQQIREELLKAAAEAGVEIEEVAPAYQAKEGEAGGETLWELFHRCRFWGPRNDLVAPVLILDQFEELFTEGRQQSEELVRQLGDLIENRMPASLMAAFEESGERLGYDARTRNYRIIISLREDFVAKLDSLRSSIPSVMRNRFEIAPLSPDQAVKVVLCAGGSLVSEEVARGIVAVVAGESVEAVEDAALPAPETEIEPAYLSVMCYELYERMKESGRSSIDADLVSREQGNILDAMYERSFSGLDARTRIFVEDRLVTPTGFRASVPLVEAEREKIPAEDLNTLVDSRILRREDRLGATHIELTHDLLTKIVKKSRENREAAALAEAERLRNEQYQAELRRSRRHLYYASALVVLLVLGIGFVLLGWYIPYKSYSKDFTRRWGGIYAVDPVPKAAVAHRQATLRLTRRGWFGRHINLIEVIDNRHQLTPSHTITTYLADWNQTETGEKPCQYEIVYRKGRVIYEIAKDRFNRTTWSFVHIPSSQASRSKSVTRGFYVDGDGYPRPQRHSRAEMVEISYNARGYEAMILYKDRRKNPIQGPDNAYGVRQEYDDQGRLTRKISLDAKHQPMNDEAGNAALSARYDQNGNLVEAVAYDAEGEKTLLNAGYHSVKIVYDRWGNEVERRFFGLSAEPAMDNEEYKAHKVVTEYNENGSVRSVRLFGKDGEAVQADATGFYHAAHEQWNRYDENGRLESVFYFDTKGNPVTAEGWHRRRFFYDSRGFICATATFDSEDAPALSDEGVWLTRYKHDERGRIVEERFFDRSAQPVPVWYMRFRNAEFEDSFEERLDPAGKPSFSGGGYHMRKLVYDSAGNVTEERYFDAQGNRTLDLGNRVHCIKRTFNPFNNCVAVEFYDEKGARTGCLNGFHRVEMTYDRSGSPLTIKWLNNEGRNCIGRDRVHLVKRQYDEQSGLIKREERYGPDNNPAVGNDGIHLTLFTHNEKRKQTRVQYFGVAQFAEDAEGSHVIESGFDTKGRRIRWTKLRADGSANLYRGLGVATETSRYDENNQRVEQAFYDSNRRLVSGPYGFAKGLRTEYANGDLVLTSVGPDGKVAFNPLYGFAIRKDQKVEGELVRSYHGPDGRLIEGPYGFAEERKRVDEEGGMVTARWFDHNGVAIYGPYGYHCSLRAPDRTRWFFDTDGRVMQPSTTNAFVPVMFIEQLEAVDVPPGAIGIQAGDIVLSFGNWSFFATLGAAATRENADLSAIEDAVEESFLAERNRLAKGPVPMTVLRGDTLIRVKLPQREAAQMVTDHRLVPVATLSKRQGLSQDRPATTMPVSWSGRSLTSGGVDVAGELYRHLGMTWDKNDARRGVNEKYSSLL